MTGTINLNDLSDIKSALGASNWNGDLPFASVRHFACAIHTRSTGHRVDTDGFRHLVSQVVQEVGQVPVSCSTKAASFLIRTTLFDVLLDARLSVNDAANFIVGNRTGDVMAWGDVVALIKRFLRAHGLSDGAVAGLLGRH